jgi:hypothetical protein
MSKARLVITALFVDHQTPAEVAARYGVHRAWMSRSTIAVAFVRRSSSPHAQSMSIPDIGDSLDGSGDVGDSELGRGTPGCGCGAGVSPGPLHAPT